MRDYLRPLGTSILGAAAAATGWACLFPPLNLGGLAWLFLIPGLWWAATRPAWRPFLAAQSLGLLSAWSFLLIWLRNADPAAAFGVPLLAGVLASFQVAWWALARWLLPQAVAAGLTYRLLTFLGLAGAWVILEWSRSWVLTGFPWLPLAASQWTRPLMLQPAAIIGAWGMSGLVVLANLALFSWLWRLVNHARDGWRRLCPEFHLVALTLVVFWVHGFRQMVASREVPFAKVAFVQPDVPQGDKWDPSKASEILDSIETVHRAAAAARPDIVLWPEAVLPYALREDPFLVRWTHSAARVAEAPVLLGTIDIERKGGDVEIWHNAAFLVLPATGFNPASYVKRKLVPFGEYVPLRSLAPGLAKLVPIGGDFEPGSSPSLLAIETKDGRALRFGPLICYEDLFPSLARSSAAAGADALVVLTNNGWFGREAFALQHAAHSVLRAIETRRPVLRCGNAGWSGWIDEYGRVRYSLTETTTHSPYFRGAGSVEVRAAAEWVGAASPYVRHGDKAVSASAALAAFAILLRRRRKTSRPSDGGEERT